MFHIGTISIFNYLSQLEAMFERKGCKLIIKVGDALTILKSQVIKHNIEKIYSHHETWNKDTRNRDKTIESGLLKTLWIGLNTNRMEW